VRSTQKSNGPRWRVAAALALVVAAAGSGAVAATTVPPSDTGGGAVAATTVPPSDTGGGGGGGTIVVIPKQTSDPFFVAVDNGARAAAEELGYEIEFLGPATADTAGQITAIEQAIELDPVAITIAALDPDAVVPALQAARDAGILVSTYNADTNPEARDFYVDQADPQAIADTVIQEMIDALGGETSGEFLVVTSVLTAPNQNLWIELMQERLASDYPDMTIAEILPGNDDQQQAQQVTRTYMQANPDTTGIWVMGGGMPGAVLALQQLGIDTADVPVTGLCIPSVVRDYLKDGSIKDCSLWDPTDLGYAAVYGIDYQLKDELPFGESTTIEVGELGELSFEDDTITLGDPVIFTAENIDDYDF
jgi:rhamnose transport system substrate-binding protein